MKPDISVIIPTYRNQKGLKACLDALSFQTMDISKIEIVVLDNEPSEETEKIVRGFQAASYYAEPSGTVACLRNIGAEKVRSDVLAFIDDDCIPEKGWLLNGTSFMREKGADIVAGRINITFLNPSSPNSVESYNSITGFRQKVYVNRMGRASTCNIFISRECFRSVGPFNEKLKLAEDFEWTGRAVSMGKVMLYTENAVVNHPAKKDIRNMLLKEFRVVSGSVYLERLSGRSGIIYVLKDILKYVVYFLSIFKEPQYWKGNNRIGVLCIAFYILLCKIGERIRIEATGRLAGSKEARDNNEYR